MTCDLQQETVLVKNRCKGHTYKTIEPYINVLGDEFLRGLRPKTGKAPRKMEVDFGIRDMDLSKCTRDRFRSGSLRKFLCRDLRRLEQKGKTFCDDFSQPLTKDLRQVIPPRLHSFWWVVSSKEALLDAVQEETGGPTYIFVVVGCYGVLKGEVAISQPFFESSVPRSSFLDYKMLAAWNDWKEKYPFSLEGYQKCLNYKKKRGWRK